MRILVVTHAGGSPHHGPNMRWYYLGQALKSYGIEVEIVSSAFFHKYINPPAVTEPLQTENIDGLAYHWLKTRPYTGRGIGQVINQVDFVARIFRHTDFFAKRRPDIVVASSPHPFVVWPASKIAKLASAKLVYEVRDLWPALLKQLGNFSDWHPYIVANRLAERFAVRNADLICSVKPGDIDYFRQEYGIESDRFAYIPNGFLPGGAKEDAPLLLRELRSRYKYLIGYVGALSRYYGLDELVRLASEFKKRDDVAFVVFGGGDQVGDIAALAKGHGLEHFYMPGKIPRAQVESTMAMFDICYAGLQDLDIHQYGISCNKIYEYMFCGKPVFGCYQAGYDPVEKAQCGTTVAPGHVDGQVAAMIEMLASAERRDVMGKNGKRYFEKNHNFDAIAKSLSEKFRQLALHA